ncbi:MAG: cobalt-precorrin-5B (C(1))-methyltransferase [Pseudomonadota bacterium]|jgi:cobalt-precorrin-5B (C1)-methyltransferase|uniref:Cobalt-precorrin-5B C(1)-methyltransferase n=1 Tax=Polaromonas aquatica TaxID=332657 RepID=A0ABW1TV28_9BURK|nr:MULTISPECIES: cobalt-precorrin-5B (C(1))-methyltransferase [unclassified Polaromonas]MEA3395002.1 cobalt-precorrin-5B (C(1))-methyltransferase [Pseudomonadota bacterium]PHM19361.1 MAG: cobalt-precorrin-5B (C(1))-methyltransferase [Curvibacter sp. PD_MW3]MDI1341937.1 cobalt-precorrin-5B (C(1))-methyltransferase [Polaromonas sp.]OYY31664.1 MAG: cobalt-precorrin-5B (C(1))-methyltransferase [Polaromonas sp. 35-63-35]OYZ13328.1 MAG: cobalt-precorrin-5B (C(1))-methyltransferase [Polaromonas sp. 1
MMKKDAPRGTRTGFTTGACSAAAARAAVIGLVTGQVPDAVECLLPNGDLVTFAVQDGRVDGVGGGASAHAMVIKDAGDDPDCTDKAHLTADVRLLPERPGEVLLLGGSGVGTVTLPGLGLAVGGPAINPVPRRNIEANVRAAGASLLDEAGFEVTISVPQGEQMAKKTTNARLGILGGISILGTTGIVKPYSTAAWRASVVQGVHVAGTLPEGVVVLTTGGRTEKFVMEELPHLPEAAFVQMGDFLRYAMGAAVKAGLKKVVIGGMVGKLTKIAQGETITHAGRAEVDTGLLADIAAGLGAAPDVCDAIRQNETARYAGERMDALGLGQAFHTALAQRVIQTLRTRYPDQFELKVLVCDFDGRKIAEAP